MKIIKIVMPLLLVYAVTVAQQKGKTIYKDSVYFELKKAPVINSDYDEYCSILNEKGTMMYYTSNKPTEQSSGKKKEQIYVSIRENVKAEWNNGELLPTVVNVEKRNNSAVYYDENKNKLYVYRDGVNGHGNILETEIKEKEYSLPVVLPFNSKFHESSLVFAEDNKVMYLITENKGGKGKRDIWKTNVGADGNWGELENVTALNTAEDEESIHLENNGKTMYFSSKGHNSKGGFDIYKSELTNGSWSKPERLSEPVNSEKDDLFYTRHQGVTYFSSNRGGNYDIYTLTEQVAKVGVFIPAIELTLKVTVKDKKTGKPLSSLVELVDVENNSIVTKNQTDSTEGKMSYLLPKKMKFRVNVTATDYMFLSEDFEVTDTTKTQTIEKIINLDKIEKGAKVVLKNIFFDTDKATIRSESYLELDELVEFLNENEKITVEISGHTDNVGKDDYNLKLSSNRAKSVYEYLLSKNIKKEKIQYKGYGEKQPIDSNETESGRQNNRRTEFKILSVK